MYLDTVVLIGTLSTRFLGEEFLFAFGAATASFIFFFSLAYGATYLRPFFSKPVSWRILEHAIAIAMWSIAFKLKSETRVANPKIVSRWSDARTE